MKCSMKCENRELNAGNTCCCQCAALYVCQHNACEYARDGRYNAETAAECKYAEEEK